MKQKVTLVLSEGEPKKHSVRKPVLGSKDIDASNIPDFYVPRRVLDALGAEDDQVLLMSFEIGSREDLQ